jgi:hypothetical protein
VSLKEHGLLFWTVVGVSALLVASPMLNRLLVYPRTEFFTEFWILDANRRTEDYPFNVTSNHNYSVSLRVANHLGYCAYYLIEAKLRNQTEPAPTSFGPVENRVPSSLPSLFNITGFVADEAVWEQPLTFSLDYELNETPLRVELNSLTLNDVVLDVKGHTMAWDSNKNAFLGNLFFELWIFNETLSDFQYHARFVGLWLNMTTS